MNIKVSSNLYDLAKLFGEDTPLFVVGGYVRNSLLRLRAEDVDICSCLKLIDVKKLLVGTKFDINIKSAKLNTCEIICGDEKYEYATFRKEFYAGEGEHTPCSIDFDATIVEDVSRRDFTCNSLYYEILNGIIIDFFGGQKDIKDKILKTVATPESVLCNDGVRVLRLVRFASELNFTIDADTYDMAVKYKSNLKSISKDRIRDEFVKILTASNTYTKVDRKSLFNKNRGYNGVKLIDKLNLWLYFGADERIKYMRGVGAYLRAFLKCKTDEVMSFAVDSYFYLKSSEVVTSPSDFVNMLFGSTGLNFTRKVRADILNMLKMLDELDSLRENFDAQKAKKLKAKLNTQELKMYAKALGGKLYLIYKKVMNTKE